MRRNERENIVLSADEDGEELEALKRPILIHLRAQICQPNVRNF